jgi:hypothetical protein
VIEATQPIKDAKVTICTIVLSYNRPRMLLEALRSIRGADQVILVDDGSDFDVWSLAAPELERFEWKEIRVAPKMSVEKRLSTARLGMAINMALRSTFCWGVTYLCDDDLFHPDWIVNVRQFFTEHPMDHVVRADWGTFNEGETPGDNLCPLHKDVQLTTGNFAHTSGCSVEHKVTWDEKTIGSHDGSFVPKILNKHPLGKIHKLKGIAGWRREHDFNMLKFTDGIGYAKAAGEVLSRKTLE